MMAFSTKLLLLSMIASYTAEARAADIQIENANCQEILAGDSNGLQSEVEAQELWQGFQYLMQTDPHKLQQWLNIDHTKLDEIKNISGVLFTDCYWSGEDSYALAIWNQITIDQQSKLLEKMPHLKDYVAHLVSSVTPQNLGYESDPYYLSPLPLHHLDNEKLTLLIKKNKELAQSLSKMRCEKLDLSAIERIALAQGDSASQVNAAVFASEKPSPFRSLKSTTQVQLRSIAEEVEILEVKNPSVELISSIASWGWISLLPKDMASQFIKSFSAKDLAACWIGPENILKDLESLMPANKMALIKSYENKMNKTRRSPVLFALQKQVVEYISTNGLKKVAHDESQDFAA